MRIHVNGRALESNEGHTLQELITRSVKTNDFLVAELNGQIVKKPNWPSIKLNEGDTLELVTLYGGG